MIAILGPTACGKTRFAAALADSLNGEIISADSRQVYRGMDIGTGKDYGDYLVNGRWIPHHLIDIADAGTEYNVFRYQRDFLKVFQDIKSRDKLALLCGGSGLYLEAVLSGYRLATVPVNKALREELNKKTDQELEEMLSSLRTMHNSTDLGSRKRTIRAIEIAHCSKTQAANEQPFPEIKSLLFGIHLPRDILRKRITDRLHSRLGNGMIEEVKSLLKRNTPAEALIRYGLEYKFITRYLLGETDRDEMIAGLNTAIHRFAKRQNTWFRRMQRNGCNIHWIDGEAPTGDMTEQALEIMSNAVTE